VRRNGAGVLVVGVFGLGAVEMPVGEIGRLVQIAVGTDKEALVANLVAEQNQVRIIPPGGAIGIGDGFGQLVAECVIGGVGELAIGRAGGRVFAAGAGTLPGFDGKEHMAEIGVSDAVVISAKTKGGKIVRGIADVVGGRVKAGIDAGRKKQAINVSVTAGTHLGDHAVQDGNQVRL